MIPKRCGVCASCTDPYYPGLCLRWTEEQKKKVQEHMDRWRHNVHADTFGNVINFKRSGMQPRPSAACYRALLGKCDDDGCAGCLSASNTHPCLSHSCQSWCRLHYVEGA